MSRPSSAGPPRARGAGLEAKEGAVRREEGFSEEDRSEQDEAARLDREHLARLRRARQRRVIKIVVALAILVIFIVFIIGNSDRQPIDFVFVESEVPLIWVMLACAVLGGIVGFILGRPGRQFRFHRDDDEDERRR
jgi:uncharacterized integral membrane protein